MLAPLKQLHGCAFLDLSLFEIVRLYINYLIFDVILLLLNEFLESILEFSESRGSFEITARWKVDSQD